MTKEELIDVFKVIHTTVRSDQKGECWTIRKYLDDHGIYNGDISGGRRLVEEVCKHVLKASGKRV